MNIFGINGGELIILIVLALLLLGPEKIPEYLRKLREWVHKIRLLAEGAKEQFKEETGTDFDEVDWQKYDPRQYDPRRVIREALSEPIEDLEASLNDAKTTVQDAADTVLDKKPVERPALTQAEILAAAVPIDQLNQTTQFPDPMKPAALHGPGTAPVMTAANGNATTGLEPEESASSAPAPQPVSVEQEVTTTPFDTEAT
ncbi:MAG TPA: Sec-independent protein translocase TatB [Enteractinococcus sp.]